MKNINGIDIFLGIMLTGLGLTMVMLIGTIIREDKLVTRFRNGEITTEQYCNKATNGGTDNSIPVVCYEYFRVKNVCSYNVALKMPSCHDEPILEAY